MPINPTNVGDTAMLADRLTQIGDAPPIVLDLIGLVVDRADHDPVRGDHDWDEVPDYQWRGAYELLSLTHGLGQPASHTLAELTHTVCRFVAQMQRVEYAEYLDKGATVREVRCLGSLYHIIGERLDDWKREISAPPWDR